MEGYSEWVQNSQRWRFKERDTSISVALHKWTAGGHIYFWPPIYCSEEQKSKVMVVYNRFVKNILRDLVLILRIKFFFWGGIWRYFLCCPGWLRSFIADYGVPLMVLLWTALSFSVPRNVPSDIPRRLYSPLAWESASLHHWTVMKVN